MIVLLLKRNDSGGRVLWCPQRFPWLLAGALGLGFGVSRHYRGRREVVPSLKALGLFGEDSRHSRAGLLIVPSLRDWFQLPLGLTYNKVRLLGSNEIQQVMVGKNGG
jgi:hypothetical protein